MSEFKEIKGLFKELKAAPKFMFPARGIGQVPSPQGVYFITDPGGTVLDVGKTDGGKEGLVQRIKNQIEGKSSFSRLYLKPKNIILKNWAYYQFLPVPADRTRALLEHYAIGRLCPDHIGFRKSTPNDGIK